MSDTYYVGRMWARFVDVVLGRAAASQPRVEIAYSYLRVPGGPVAVEVELRHSAWKRPRWPIASRLESVARVTCDSKRWSAFLEGEGWKYDEDDGRLSMWLIGVETVDVATRVVAESVHMGKWRMAFSESESGGWILDVGKCFRPKVLEGRSCRIGFIDTERVHYWY